MCRLKMTKCIISVWSLLFNHSFYIRGSLFYIFLGLWCGSCSARWLAVTTASSVLINIFPILTRHMLKFCYPFWNQFILKVIHLFKILGLSVISTWLYWQKKNVFNKQDHTILDICTKIRFFVPTKPLRIWKMELPATETDFIALYHPI